MAKNKIPKDAEACLHGDCYYYTLTDKPIGDKSYIPGPDEYVNVNRNIFGDSGKVISTTIGSALGVVSKNHGVGMLGSLTVDNIKANQWAVYETRVPVQTYQKTVRYVWLDVKNSYQDKTFNYTKIIGPAERVGKPIRYE